LPTIIWSKSRAKDKLDPSMKKKAFAFFEKLQEDDSLPGLNIEEIKGSRDTHVRTGRVDDNFRAVLFKLKDTDEPVYVFHGIWPHDEANEIAEKVTLSINPVNGMPEVRMLLDDARGAIKREAGREPPTPESKVEDPAPSDTRAVQTPDASQTTPWSLGVSAGTLAGVLGIDADLAEAAAAATSEDAFQSVVECAEVEWQGLALLALATGSTVHDVRTEFHLDEDVDDSGTEEEQLVRALSRTAAKASFHWIDDNDELRQIVEAGDFGAWRVFLHPEQRNYVDRNWNGAFRLSGGAGTGKTVVAIHRARRLAQSNPQARILLTTYTRNLADDLETQLQRLDAKVPLAKRLGEPGIYVKGIDALAWAVIQGAGNDVAVAASTVLGSAPSSIIKGSRDQLWQAVIRESGNDLPPALRTVAFITAEYALVILPNRITTLTGYLRVRRSGLGVALDRAQRTAVWNVVASYRSMARVDDTTDFEEKAAIAAEWLGERAAAGEEPLFDHVLVDEAQDLTPSRLQLLRALVAEGPNDLFLCEDSHQRIYGQKITLGQYGIRIVGRSRRLTLNYRTTEQNLRWAMSVLSGADYTDMEGEPELAGSRSARSGPEPVVTAASSAANELSTAAEVLRSWLPDESDPEGRAPSPESIAILVPDRYTRDLVANGLRERGIPVRAVDTEAVKPGLPVVMTMHRAKGLEFTHVLVFDLRDSKYVGDGDEDDARLRDRSLVYVAATRARDVLAVSWHGDRPKLLSG